MSVLMTLQAATLQATHEMSGSDPLSLGMFWAGALMAFAPLIFAGAVLGAWWRARRRATAAGAAPADPQRPMQDVRPLEHPG